MDLIMGAGIVPVVLVMLVVLVFVFGSDAKQRASSEEALQAGD